MVIHRLVPQANDNVANGLDVKVGCIVVVGDGDGQLDGVAPGKRGIERQQGCSHTLRTPPDHGMTGVEEAAVVRVLHVNLNAVGAVVGKREQVGVRGIVVPCPTQCVVMRTEGARSLEHARGGRWQAAPPPCTVKPACGGRSWIECWTAPLQDFGCNASLRGQERTQTSEEEQCSHRFGY